MRQRIIATIVFLIPAVLMAQAGRAGTGRQTPDSVFARAVALNNEQRGAEARALVDSVIRAAAPTSALHAEGLFWKGILAESDQTAEESFTKLVVDFPLHRRAEESLIRLAQLEMARGNRTQSQRYLDRLIVEHPYGPYRARASYWRARLFFEENEVERACAELGIALARLQPDDVELKQQVEFAARRCATVPRPSTTGRGDTAAAARGRGAATRGGAGAARGRSGATGTSDSARTRTTYTVQAAAFPEKVNADAFAEALKGRGFEPRIVGVAPWFRVHLGMFPSREEAQLLANELKTRRISSDAFVVEVPGR